MYCPGVSSSLLEYTVELDTYNMDDFWAQDAPKSYVVILAAQSYESLNGQNINFVLLPTWFYTKKYL